MTRMGDKAISEGGNDCAKPYRGTRRLAQDSISVIPGNSSRRISRVMLTPIHYRYRK
jgi:hypothetical protein